MRDHITEDIFADDIVVAVGLPCCNTNQSVGTASVRGEEKGNCDLVFNMKLVDIHLSGFCYRKRLHSFLFAN